MRTITLENIGPIDRLRIPLPEAGVVVLRGRNGVGKSHALEAVDALVSGRGRPPCRDNASRGVVEGVGARLTIGRSTRRTGEAEVVTLEGRLDISQLVQPPIKDDESADRTRIKALVQLAGAAADPSLFAGILPEGVQLGDLVPPSEQTDDPVVLAGRIKRALEAEARRWERQAEEARAKAHALQEQTPAVKTCLDRQAAEAELQQALLALKELETRAAEAQRQRQRVEEAQRSLERARASIPADQSVEALAAEESELTAKIDRLREALTIATERRQQVRRQLDQARLVAAQIAEAERLLATCPQSVPAEEIAPAKRRVDEAREIHAAAVEAERARRLAVDADLARRAAAEAAERAARLRESARATDDVLSELVGRVTRRLRVDAGRLVCDTDRGAEPFAELSPGERWRIALEVAAEQVGQGGLVTVPQEAWEGLDPVHRAEVAEIARHVGVVILTAEADGHKDITAEIVP